MNKSWLGGISTVLVIILVVWLFGGTKISCYESFWDKDKQIIEIEKQSAAPPATAGLPG